MLLGQAMTKAGQVAWQIALPRSSLSNSNTLCQPPATSKTALGHKIEEMTKEIVRTIPLYLSNHTASTINLYIRNKLQPVSSHFVDFYVTCCFSSHPDVPIHLPTYLPAYMQRILPCYLPTYNRPCASSPPFSLPS